jgi:hypothetical protein
MDINDLARKVSEQADRLFPNRTDSSMFLKLFSEIGEMVGSPDDAMEVADVFIMLLDYAHRKGINITQVVEYKMAVNNNRQWKVNALGVMSHE